MSSNSRVPAKEIWLYDNPIRRQASRDKFVTREFAECDVRVYRGVPSTAPAVDREHCGNNRAGGPTLPIAGVLHPRPRHHSSQTGFALLPIAEKRGRYTEKTEIVQSLNYWHSPRGH